MLTPHSTKPVSIQQAIPHEGNILKSGLFNGGMVGMRRSATAQQASEWLSERLEAYGHAYAHRQGTGLPSCHDFEFADQIWLNLMFLYFQSDTAILNQEIFNLGHWNLHQGELELRDGFAYFNGERVVMAHFSGLPPKEKLEFVSCHSKLYNENQSQPWAMMAKDYLKRLESANTSSPSIPYSYTNIQPSSANAEAKQVLATLTNRQRSLANRMIHKFIRIARSPAKITGGLKLARWQLHRTRQDARAPKHTIDQD